MLDIKNVTMTFNPGTVNAKRAIDDLSLTVDDGDFVTIIGANGAGKSTLFNIISGSFFVDSGVILLDGKDVTLVPEHVRARSIGRLRQDPMLGTAPDMSIEDNLRLAAGSGGWMSGPDKRDHERFREALSKLDMGLEDRMQQPVGLLSGGQRQALTLMMATLNPPKLLLLDEHTAALDPATADKVIAITEEIVREKHITCLMVTHNMQSALDLGNRTIMMDRGRIIYDVKGAERDALTMDDLLVKFKEQAGKALDTDRILLTE